MTMTRMPSERAPTHPGVMLLEEFLKPLGMTQTELATRLGVPYPRVNEIVNGKRGITPDTALRLARLFRTSPRFWLNGQIEYDLYRTLRSRAGEKIRRIKPVRSVPA